MCSKKRRALARKIQLNDWGHVGAGHSDMQSLASSCKSSLVSLDQYYTIAC